MTEQVLAEMAEARARLAAAEAEIQAVMGRALAAVRDAVDSIILESGFSRSEVLGLSQGPAPEKASAKRARKAVVKAAPLVPAMPAKRTRRKAAAA